MDRRIYPDREFDQRPIWPIMDRIKDGLVIYVGVMRGEKPNWLAGAESSVLDILIREGRLCPPSSHVVDAIMSRMLTSITKHNPQSGVGLSSKDR